MAISGFDDLVNRLTGGNSGTPETVFFNKDVTTQNGGTPGSPAFAFWTSLWAYDGNPCFGDSPGTTIDSVSYGDPGSIRYTGVNAFKKVLTGASVSSTTTGTLMIYDRILHVGGLDGTDTAKQSVTGSSSIRYYDAAGRSADSALGNMIFVEIAKVIGSTGTTCTIEYQGADGMTYNSPLFSIGGTNRMEADRMLPMPLAQGINGGKEMPIGFTGLTLSASTGDAGNIAIVLARPLLFLPCNSTNVPHLFDLICSDPAVIPLQRVATLAMAYYAGNAGIPSVCGHVQIVEGTEHLA